MVLEGLAITVIIGRAPVLDDSARLFIDELVEQIVFVGDCHLEHLGDGAGEVNLTVAQNRLALVPEAAREADHHDWSVELVEGQVAGDANPVGDERWHEGVRRERALRGKGR